jgi:hypothetical protein
LDPTPLKRNIDEYPVFGGLFPASFTPRTSRSQKVIKESDGNNNTFNDKVKRVQVYYPQFRRYSADYNYHSKQSD